jgi:hypothetical protein
METRAASFGGAAEAGPFPPQDARTAADTKTATITIT